VSSLQDITL